ncbi:hypothetical protein ACFQZX_19420 [Mucilaginibacter litoreus]|uniref:Glycosyltransferase family 10 (Fucosyltransferase) C-term n=1 Tax=Mucilaginibacter litoreus TaxID=1048221 RepID=A0ABW3AZ06_9SPHI
MFKKKNLAAKLWLKHTNREKYKEYKWNLANQKLIDLAMQFNAGSKLDTLHKLRAFCLTNKNLNVLHSGNSGDIIYALPTLKRIYELTGVQINFYLKLDQPMHLYPGATHPLGNVMLNRKMAEMLFPLIRSQEYIHSCEIEEGQRIDVDLDDFRRSPIPLDRGNIARWCGYVTGVTPELYKPWLKVEPDNTFNDKIVLARSERYRNSFLDHNFLSKYKNLVFVGVASEYKDIKNYIPNVEWVQVEDFMQLARIIAGSKFFIGNQSFPFSVAEGLKVPRILETFYGAANVIPEGENAHEIYFQQHFESLVMDLNGNVPV